MKRGSEDAISASRRRVLKSVAAGAGLSVLPCASALAGASAAPGYAPRLLVGYCPLSAISDKGTAPVDAASVLPVRGSYELSVIGANTSSPLAVAAQYASAQHTFWQAWQAQRVLQRSPPITIRWSATAGNALPLAVKIAQGSGAAQVTAREGIYALVIVPALSPIPAWNTMSLKPVSTGGVSMRLLSRATRSDVVFPYLLFSVQSGDVALTA